MENIIGLKEFRADVEKYVAVAEKGIPVIVMRRSRPFFKISAIQKNDETWEEVIDFTKIEKGGVSIPDILSRLKK